MLAPREMLRHGSFQGNTLIKEHDTLDRVITFTHEDLDPSVMSVGGTFQFSIDGTSFLFPITGTVVRWDGAHNRWLFSLVGTGSVWPDDGTQPAERFGICGIYGYADGGSQTTLPEVWDSGGPS